MKQLSAAWTSSKGHACPSASSAGFVNMLTSVTAALAVLNRLCELVAWLQNLQSGDSMACHDHMHCAVACRPM
jgi:hypothetical protein